MTTRRGANIGSVWQAAKMLGKVLLSGYDNDLYNQILIGWRKVSKKTQAEAGIPRVETLWMNYEIGQVELPLGL